MDTGRNPSDRGDNSLFERFGNRKKVGVALGIVAALGISGCSQEVGANPSPVETSTSQSTESTEAPTKGPTAPAETISPSPSPSETTSLRPTAPETETAVAEIPNLRPDGEPWTAVDQYAEELKSVQQQAEESGVPIQGKITEITRKFIEANRSEPLPGSNDGTGGVFLSDKWQKGGTHEDRVDLAERALQSIQILQALAVQSQPGSDGDVLSDAGLGVRFGDEGDSFVGAVREGLNSGDSSKEAAAKFYEEKMANYESITFVHTTPAIMEGNGFTFLGIYVDNEAAQWYKNNEMTDADFYNVFKFRIDPSTGDVRMVGEGGLYGFIEDGVISSGDPVVQKLLGQPVGDMKAKYGLTA